MQKPYIYLPYFGFPNLFRTPGPFISNPLLPCLVPQKKTCIHQILRRYYKQLIKMEQNVIKRQGYPIKSIEEKNKKIKE